MINTSLNIKNTKKLLSKKIFLFSICIVIFLHSNAQNADSKKFNFRGYSGGMMLHTGYLYSGKMNINAQKIIIQGFPTGIGGAMRFHFGKNFRVGGEGYASTLSYGEKNNSYISLGWGGLLVDYHWQINKFSIFFGGTLGGGGIKNVTVTNTAINSIKENAIYQKYSIMIVDPFVGMEYGFTQRMSVTAKIDWILNISEKRTDLPTGARVYLGFSFFHSKNTKK